MLVHCQLTRNKKRLGRRSTDVKRMRSVRYTSAPSRAVRRTMAPMPPSTPILKRNIQKHSFHKWRIILISLGQARKVDPKCASNLRKTKWKITITAKYVNNKNVNASNHTTVNRIVKLSKLCQIQISSISQTKLVHCK